MRVWIDPDRLPALNLAPGDVHAALQRNNYLAAVGQTKGNLVQVNLLANTDLRSADEFKDLIVAERERRHRPAAATWRRWSWGPRRRTWSPSTASKEAVYLGVWPLVGVNEIDVAHRLRAEMERIRPTLPPDVDMQTGLRRARSSWRTRSKEITKTLTETILIVGLVVFLFMGSIRTALVPLVAMPVSLVGAAIVMFAVRLQPQPADHPRHRAVGRAWWSTTRSSWWRTSSATCARARRAIAGGAASARASWSGRSSR